MKIDNFITLIENMYGKYDSNLKTVIIQFLDKSIQKEIIGKVYVAIINYQKVNFGVQCIAKIK